MASQQESSAKDSASVPNPSPVTVLDLMGQASASVPRIGAAAEQPGPAADALAPEEDLEARVDRLSEALESVPEPGRSVAEELVSAVLAMHGEGLARIRELIDDDTAARLVADPQVASLLLIHDLYPVSLEDRVVEGLDAVRPYMESHGGNVELLRVEDGVAYLKLEGSCHGCAASASTLELAIKKSLDETAPDLLGVEVEGEDAEPTHDPPIAGTALPMAANGSTPTASAGGLEGWAELDGLGSVPEGATLNVFAGESEVLVANVSGTLLAYRDACAACGASLAGAAVSSGILACPACAARFDLPKAGRGVDDDSAQLGPVPLLRDGADRVRIALGT